MINIKKTSSLFVWVLLMVSCATLSCAKEAPKLKRATLQYDLGNRGPKHRVQTIIAEFTNQGGGELVITDVGDKIKIRVDLTPFFPGPILKKVAIYVNDQPKPVVITIKGNVVGTE